MRGGPNQRPKKKAAARTATGDKGQARLRTLDPAFCALSALVVLGIHPGDFLPLHADARHQAGLAVDKSIHVGSKRGA